MNKRYMTGAAWSAFLFSVLCVFVSCLKDEETVKSPECVITSMKVADIKTTVWSTDEDGDATTFVRTIGGSEVFFRIDQLGGLIETVDSLPEWVDVSRVVPTLVYSGYVYCRQYGNEDFKLLSNGKDSLDFTNDVEFLVQSLDGTGSRTYVARINLTSSVKDSLYWNSMKPVPAVSGGLQKARMVGCKGDVLCVLHERMQGDVVQAVVARGTVSGGEVQQWEEQIATVDGGAGLQTQSVLAWNGALVGLDSDGHVCRSDDGVTWSVQSDNVFDLLLAADEWRVYAFADGQILSSSDLESWLAEGVAAASELPQMPVSVADYETRTNASLHHVVAVGPGSEGDKASVWYKVSSAGDGNQLWAHVDDPNFPLPAMEGLSVVKYGDELLAFGRSSDANGLCRIYRSADNGVSWHEALSKLTSPEPQKAYDGVAMTVMAGRMWLLGSDGRLWNGKFGKF